MYAEDLQRPAGSTMAPTLPPWLMHPPRTGDLGPAIVGVAAASIGISTVAVVLRFWSRAGSTSLAFWWDDWLVLITTIVSHGFLSLYIAWTKIGFGKHVEFIPVTSMLPSVYYSKASIVLHALCIWLIKISALFLFARIFRQSVRFRRLLWILGVAVTCWLACTAVVPWFNCHPIRRTLDPMVPGYCFERMGWFYTSAFLNAFFDLVILVLPMPLIWRLHMTVQRKISITFVFTLGYCTAFLSFARFIIIIRDAKVMSATLEQDPYWRTVPLLILSMLEAPFAIVALCAPAIGQLTTRIIKHRRFPTWSKVFSSGSTTPEQTSNSRNNYFVEKTMSYKVDYYSALPVTYRSSSEGWAKNHNKPGFGSSTAIAAARRKSGDSQTLVDPIRPLGAMVAPSREPQDRGSAWSR
ncbi:Satratoxin biosynthesis SC15 cluster protein [Paramyrothecium foliicola]|nr:Satratoxin biosynthesis SC15 cluster protein [Paramyrothecium foliicola]